MSKLFVGGVVLAALFPLAPAIAGSASPALPQPATQTRHSFFTASQARTDVAAHVEKMFKALDTNRDGFITKAEIAALQAEFDERTAKTAPKRVARMFNRLDADHDGKITVAEAASGRRAKANPAKSSRRSGSSLFAQADANSDGVVTRSEFDAAIASGKVKLHHTAMRGSQIVRLFDSADTAKQGRISLDEAQQAELRQFDAADLNHDGILTPDERRQAAKANRVKRPAA